MKGNYRNLLLTLTSCLIINSCFIITANADPQNQIQPTYNDASLTSDNTWHFLIAPYFWGSSINGTINVHGFSNDFSVPFTELVSHLDFGGEVHMEANNGPWTLMLDPTYLKLSDTKNVGNSTIDLTSQTVLADGGVFYNMFTNAMPNNQMLALDLFGGTRYLGLENSLGITVSSPIPQVSFHTSTQVTNSFLVPIVGARMTFDASPTQHFWLRGDVGGFGIDNVSNTWQAIAGYAYSVSDDVDVGLAYRVLKIEMSKNDSSASILFYGPELGVAFHF